MVLGFSRYSGMVWYWYTRWARILVGIGIPQKYQSEIVQILVCNSGIKFRRKTMKIPSFGLQFDERRSKCYISGGNTAVTGNVFEKNHFWDNNR
jgi:hypothetical protein